jgi:hypothetical protein
MAGFIDRNTNSSTAGRGRIRSAFDKIVNFGADYTDLLIKGSEAVGPLQHSQAAQVLSDRDMYYAIKMADISSGKSTPANDKSFQDRLQELRQFAMNHEIENMLNIIADESIVYDEENYFCYPEYDKILGYLKKEQREEIKQELDDAFRQVYAAWNFNDISAWHYFYQWLIDGYLAFEIIYDESYKNIIGFQYIEPWSLEKATFTTKSGKLQRGWIQYGNSPKDRRELVDEKVIIISYKKEGVTGRDSYTERLVRPFNLLRNIEHAMIIWRIMNSSFRMKFVVPTGTRAKGDFEQTIGQVLALYKEEIQLDSESGDVTVNGVPGMQFYKNYIIPSKQGEQTEIEPIAGQGPDMGDPNTVKYFETKFIRSSQIPSGRFNTDLQPTFVLGAEGISREEQAFSKFILRLRSQFQEIIVKPFKIQFFLRHPEFINDMIFATNMGVRFNKDNLFEEMKRIDVANKQFTLVNSLRSYLDNDDKPFFSPEFLVKELMKSTFSDDDFRRNIRMMNQDEEELEDLAAAGAAGQPGAATPPPPAGGAPPPPPPPAV